MYNHTLQQKHLSCHSPPSALTTKSTIGFLHPLHLPLNLRVWHSTHHACPSRSTKGVLASKGSPHSAQKKCPTCHSPPHATTTSPSIGVLQLRHLGLNFSWKSRWQKKRNPASPSSSQVLPSSSGRSTPLERASIRARRISREVDGSG